MRKNFLIILSVDKKNIYGKCQERERDTREPSIVPQMFYEYMETHMCDYHELVASQILQNFEAPLRCLNFHDYFRSLSQNSEKYKSFLLFSCLSSDHPNVH